MVFFMVSSLLTVCKADCPGTATVPSQLNSDIESESGATSNKLTTRGYSLTQAKIWKFYTGADSEFLTGIEFTYSSDCCSDPNIVQMNGSTTGAYIFSVAITKKVTKVSFMKGSNSKLCDIWFTHTDGSITKTTNCSTCTVGS